MSTRRSFLKRVVQSCGLAVIAPFLLPQKSSAQESDEWISVGKSTDFEIGVPKVLFNEPVVVIRTEDGVRVLHSLCTHRGCPVTAAKDGELKCYCHGSAFDTEGKVLEGPATKPLPVLPSRIQDGQVWVKIPEE